MSAQPWGRRRHIVLAGMGIVAALLPTIAGAAGIALTSQHLTTTATCALVSYPKTTTYSFDSYVDSSNTSQNNATGTQLKLQSLSTANQRAYVQFDLTQCAFAPPAGAIVRSATLRLFEAGALPTTCRTYDVFKNSAAWTETGVTWANQPAGTTANQPPSAQRTASQQVGTSPCANSTSNSYVAWDVTVDVSAFLAGTATNDGWMIRDDSESAGSAAKVVFSAREQNNIVQAPQLLITYTRV